MKSVMQEASSIAKAFEQAWEKAGKPQQCSVKVLEEPRHNFIGMTIQSAKIALFFDEPETRNFPEKMTGVGQAPKTQRKQPQQTSERIQPQPVISQRNAGQAVTQQTSQAPRNDGQKPAAPSGTSPRNDGPRPDYWSEEMISFARNWLQDFLGAMDRADVKFQAEANKFYLRLSFEKPVYEDEQRERELFRHTSCLLLQTLRNKFSRPLKGYKIVLARA